MHGERRPRARAAVVALLAAGLLGLGSTTAVADAADDCYPIPEEGCPDPGPASEVVPVPSVERPTPPPATSSRSGVLALTGDATGTLVLVGLGAVVAGLVFVALPRRRDRAG